MFDTNVEGPCVRHFQSSTISNCKWQPPSNLSLEKCKVMAGTVFRQWLDKISILRHFAKIAAASLMDGAHVCCQPTRVLCDSKVHVLCHEYGNNRGQVCCTLKLTTPPPNPTHTGKHRPTFLRSLWCQVKSKSSVLISKILETVFAFSAMFRDENGTQCGARRKSGSCLGHWLVVCGSVYVGTNAPPRVTLMGKNTNDIGSH